ncbi:MAG: hypothetical protein Kow0098_04720 [Ignavibacteriaceae bacterium]
MKYLGKKSYREIARDLGLTHSAVSHQANRMGLKMRSKGRPWTEEEKQFIKKYYRKIPTRKIAHRLNRSVDSIINSAGPLGISRGMPKPWINDEKNFLIHNYGKLSLEKIAETLNRTPQAVSSHASKLKLTSKRKGRRRK